MSSLDHEVREVMTPGVVTISADASLPRVNGALLAHGVNAVLVVERKGGKPLGWITARGLAAHAIADPPPQTAGQAITEPVVSVSPSDSVRHAIQALLEAGASHLVVSHGRDCTPEGVLSPLDVLRSHGR